MIANTPCLSIGYGGEHMDPQTHLLSRYTNPLMWDGPQYTTTILRREHPRIFPKIYFVQIIIGELDYRIGEKTPPKLLRKQNRIIQWNILYKP